MRKLLKFIPRIIILIPLCILSLCVFLGITKLFRKLKKKKMARPA